MDGMDPDSEYTKDLEKAVADVKADEKWRREYVVLNELIRDNRRLGGYATKVASVRQTRGKYPPELIAEIILVQPAMVDAIISAIDAHPEWDDEEVAENLDFD